MRHRSNVFWVESKDKDDNVRVIGHSQDEETEEIYYKFLSKAQANKLLNDEKAVSPEYKYRIVKQMTETTQEHWH